MKRIRHWRELLVTLAIFTAACIFLLYSEFGLRLGISLLTDHLLKPLSVAEVRGRLAGPFTLSGIEYNEAENHVSLDQLTIDWKLSELLNVTAHVTEFKGKGFHFEQQRSTTKASTQTPVSLPQISFPLRLIVDDASIETITLQLPDKKSPLKIKHVALSGETKADTLQIHTLKLQSDWLELNINGNIQPHHDYDLGLDVSWLVPQQNAPSWQGKGTLQGDLRKLELQQNLSAPFSAKLDMQGYDVLGDLTWQGTLQIPRMKSSQLPFPISPAFTVGGKVEAKGDLDTATATSTFAGHVDTIGAIKGKMAANYSNKQLHLTRLVLNQQRGSAEIEASGDIDLATPPHYQLQARWQSLGWPLDTPSIQSESGQLRFSGEEMKYQFDGNFMLSGPQIPSGNWHLKGKGDNEAVTVSTLEGKVLDGAVTGNANVAFVPQVRWTVKLAAEALNPAVSWPQFPGRVSAEANFNGQLSSRGINLTVNLPSLTGTLRENKLTGHAEAGLIGNTASFKDLDVQIGSARFQAHGTLGDVIKMDWQLDAGKLADLMPQSQGQLKASGSITGPRATPRITLLMDGNGLTYTDIHADKLLADIAVDMQSQNPSRAMVHAEKLQLPGMPRQSLTLKVDGPLENHRLTLESQSAQQILHLAATAGYANKRWRGDITRIQIDDKKLGTWQLAQPTAFSLTTGEMQLAEFCLNHDEAKLCASGDWTKRNGVSADLKSARFPLQLLAPYLPRRFGIDAELNGNASLALIPDHPPQLEGDLMLGQGELRLLSAEDESPLMTLPFQKVKVRLTTSEQGKVDGELTLSFHDNEQLLLSLRTTVRQDWLSSFKQQPLQARLQISLRDLSAISSLVPDVQNVKGALDADVSLAGTVGDPKLSGYVRLDKGELDIPRAGLNLTGVQLTASGNNTEKMAITGTAHSGDGELSITGQLLPTDKGPWVLELAMKGKNFVVANIPEARMQVSPDLKVRIVGREIHIDGDLAIPSARLEPPDIKLAVKPSQDVVIVGEDEMKAKEERWLIYTHIRIHADDSIRFIGYGFDGRIGGDMLLIDLPGSLTRGSGVLDVVEGSNYEAFGTKLNIDHGRLNFADSPVDNPNLDIRASRTINEVVAGVNVTGTAKNPVMTLFSEPPMDQADILSYLTLGHPVSIANKSEGETLAGAANSAGLVGGNYLAGYFSRQFGLEEARVEARQDTQSPWLVVGKYLSPKLYIRYGVGVYEDAYSVLVRYKLTEHWQVQGEGGLHSGGDIIYTFERP